MLQKLAKDKNLRPFLSLLCSTLWALAYPCIKLGYREFEIAGNDLGGKVLFAGIRFLLAGLVVLLVFRIRKPFKDMTKSTGALLILFAIVNTTLHYLFSYVGLGYIPSSRSTIVDSMGSFMLILLSCAIFSDDKMSLQKAIGCILGFSGIVVLNITPGQPMFSDFSFLGDGMLFLNAVCAAFGGIINRFVSKKMDMTTATGLSMTLGGIILCIVGLAVGPASVWTITLVGVIALIALIIISAISFSIYNSLLAYHPISQVAIYNAFIPVFGVFFANLILKEPLEIKHLIAGAIVALGIYIVNFK